MCAYLCWYKYVPWERDDGYTYLCTEHTHPQSTEVECVIPGLAYAEPVWSFLLHSLPPLINAVYTGCAGGNWPL